MQAAASRPLNHLRFAVLLLGLWAGSALAESFALVSDLNGRYGSTEYHKRVGAAVEAILDQKPTAVISTGDMVAGQKQPRLDGPHLDQMWAAFNQTFADPLAEAGIPLPVTAGNHDGSGFPAFQLEREHFEKQWAGRSAGIELLEGSEWPWRYAARMGRVLLLTFDGTVPGKLGSRELRFVETMLDRHSSEAEATVVFSHLPMWPLAKSRERETLNDPALLALLHRYGVDVYASGHHHVFYAGTDDAGMVHLAVGALGGNARAFSSGSERQPHSLAMLEFDGESVGITALASPEFIPIDVTRLPARVEGPLGELKRLDGRARLR